MGQGAAAASRARAVRAQAKARGTGERECWDAALRHSKIAVAAAEESVALADHDDDVVLLAQTLTIKSQIHESLGDGGAALSAAREALDVYSRLDREVNNPQRVTRRLGDGSVLFPPGPARSRTGSRGCMPRPRTGSWSWPLLSPSTRPRPERQRRGGWRMWRSKLSGCWHGSATGTRPRPTRWRPDAGRGRPACAECVLATLSC